MITANLINRARGAGEIANGVELKADSAETENHFGLVEFTMIEGQPVTPMHIHHNDVESVYVLDGALTFYVGDDSFDSEAGSFAVLPKGIAHGFRVKTGAGKAQVLLLFSPGGTERFLVPTADAGEQSPDDFGLEILGAVPGS
jgi:quercetin dioxygenase-like cupin family protein